MNSEDIIFIKHVFSELGRLWKIISLSGLSFILLFGSFWFHSEIEMPLIVILLIFSYLSSPFVNNTLISLAKNKRYFLIKAVLINICALFIFEFSYMIDYHFFALMYSYKPSLIQCFILYFGGIAIWRHELTFKELIFSIGLGKVYQIKKWIIQLLAIGIILLSFLFLILTPIEEEDFAKIQGHPHSLLLQQLYLYKLKLHFTYSDFKAIYYIGWALGNQQTSGEALRLASQHYMPIQLVRFAIFSRGVQSDSLLSQINQTPLNKKIALDNLCDLDNSTDDSAHHILGIPENCHFNDDFLKLPYLLDLKGEELKNPS
jgi:hypothetical protein